MRQLPIASVDMKKRLILGGCAFFAFVLFFAQIPAFAAGQSGQYGCPTQYGGDCPSEEISLIKQVKNPKTNEFVATLENTDAKYTPGQTVSFKIIVKNTGADTIAKITIHDVFPEFVSFVSGPGKFDNNTKTLTFDVTNLKPGEEEKKESIIQGKVADEKTLPSDQGITCVVNHAETTLNGKLSTSDTQLCIEKQVLPGTTKGGLKVFPAPKAKTTPPTGPELFALIGLLPGATLGLFLRKKASK
ncbi:MAG: DUF11 domain-containing protein [Candidatus Levybacteria bacterium]|nr:DUF11 domain-containing protein [Candidatus Levybacteria bacterium]